MLLLHVLDAEWDPTPALSYLEQLRLLAADGSLPGYVDAANVTPDASILMTVITSSIDTWRSFARLPAVAACAPGRTELGPAGHHVFWPSGLNMLVASGGSSGNRLDLHVVTRCVQVQTQMVLQHDQAADALAEVAKHFSTAVPGSPQDARSALLNPTPCLSAKYNMPEARQKLVKS